MDQAEASGKTVEDALKQALTKLGARRDEVEFVVLDEGKRGGLFGRGAKDAVVRVERVANPDASGGERAPADTRIPRGRQRGGRPQPPGQGPAPARGARGGRPEARPQRRDDRRPGGGPGRRPSGRTGYEVPAPKLTEQDFLRPPRYDDEVAAEPPPSRQGRPRDRGPARETPPAQAPEGSPAAERRRREEEPRIEPDINAEEVDFAAHIVDDILRLLDISAEITIREPLTPGDGVGMVRAVVDISGDDLGILIGRRGETLLSLQYVVNLIVSRQFPGRGGVSIDVEHYRHRREEQVVSLARRMADRVRHTGAAITLEPMSAAERRLVHLALAEDPELETNSVGEGDNRKVVISTRR